MKAALTSSELREHMDGGSVVVVDVLTPEDYAECHIPGARNACVYETVFLDRIAECIADLEKTVVVYDATGCTRTAENAQEKLLQAGYKSVAVLSGGLAGWLSAGYAVEGSNPAGEKEIPLHDGKYSIDTQKSRVEWIGRNINNRHYGRISIAAGELIVRNGLPAGGHIELDMATITDFDLQDDYWRNILVLHLKSDDFFAVARFPTAKFQLTGWEPLEGAQPGNGIASGSLTIRDVTRPISFPADLSSQADRGIKAHALLDIDRTLWNVCYGSCRLYERLGMHLVHDLISLEIFVVAK